MFRNRLSLSLTRFRLENVVGNGKGENETLASIWDANIDAYAENGRNREKEKDGDTEFATSTSLFKTGGKTLDKKARLENGARKLGGKESNEDFQ